MSAAANEIASQRSRLSVKTPADTTIAASASPPTRRAPQVSAGSEEEKKKEIAGLWRHGAWLLLALAPYGVAYLSYRGAVVVAHEYGAAVAAMIDLDRFALYGALRMPHPIDTAAERRMNAKLMKLLTHNQRVVLRYEYPADPGSADGQSTAS